MFLMGIKYDGNYARRVYPPPRWYWVCMATLAAILLGVCIHAAAMHHTRNTVVRGEYAAENDRAMELYGIAVPDRDE
jgi:hypothetical protein